jgi:sigma-54 specific flagellar transcriptional regulator A
MPLFTTAEQHLAEAVSRLVYSSPFAPERTEAERQILGRTSTERHPELFREVWAADLTHPDNVAVYQRVHELAVTLRERMQRDRITPADAEMRLYEDLVLYQLYAPHRSELDAVIDRLLVREPARLGPLWDKFHAGFRHFFWGKEVLPFTGIAAGHIFALIFQIRRAFYHIYMNIVGASKPAIRLRESVWQSIFTWDTRRYARTLYKEMDRCSTLITGPSGTGKELVARAVGWSRFIPFDPVKKQFVSDFTGSFLALNLSAFAPGLIESELFGHARGAFNGAVDRQGWLQQGDEWGTVFLDEIGELDPAIQVKLLRVLQNREIQRVGESKVHPFRGKILAATNRDLAEEMRAGRFRPDLYYRLHSDMITTPSLREQLQDSPADLRKMLLFITRRVTGETDGEAVEALALTAEVEAWIDRHLGNYAWPGNFRELEQCVRNILIRREYVPTNRHEPAATETAAADPFLGKLLAGDLTLAEVEQWYVSLVFARTGSYQQAARKLGTDWRTLKRKVDAKWVSQFQAGPT